MSVINRMLKDLDKRQEASRTTYRPAAIAPARNWTRLIWIPVVLIIVVLVWLLLPEPSLESRDHAVSDDSAATQRATPQPTEAASTQPISDREQNNEDDRTIEAEASEAERLAEAQAKRQGPARSEPEFIPLPEVTTESEVTTTAQSEPQVEASSEPVSEPASATEETQSSGSMSITQVQLTPDELVARNLAKANEAFQKGDSTEGKELLEQALAVQPDHVEARLRLAAFWYGRGFGTEAVVLLRDGLDRRPQQPQLSFLLARVYQRIGQDNAALGALAGVVPGPDDALDFYSLRAELAQADGQYDVAIADYQRLTEIQPQRGQWWLSLALVQDDAGNWPAAIEAYEQARLRSDLSRDAVVYASDRIVELQASEGVSN